MIQCIEDTSIPVCMVGLLYALPNTQLTRRLQAEGRLFPDHDAVHSDEDSDQCTSGLNFVTMRPREQTLEDYRRVLETIYAPGDYFHRVRQVGRQLDCSRRRFRQPLVHVLRDLRSFLRMAWRMGIRDAKVRRHWWHTMLDCLVRNPRAMRYVGAMTALYLHMGPFSRYVVALLAQKIEAIQIGKATTPQPQTAPLRAPA
jgi:hypothetical protein